VIVGLLKILSTDISMMQITMLAGAAFSFGAGAAMCLADAGIELGADTAAAISFGDDQKRECRLVKRDLEHTRNLEKAR
jgi:hypothetical protein